MLATRTNHFTKILTSVAEGVQPSANRGTAITPGNNVYGSYTEVMSAAAVTDDGWEIWVYIASVAASTAAKDCLVTIGLDWGGGTHIDFISHLAGSCAQSATSGPVVYRFPVRIPAGTSIGAKASVNNATVGTVRVWVELRCAPTRPRFTRCGSFVRTFGAVTANSAGTAITPGTASPGAWVQLGAATVEPLWWWELGYGINDATMTTQLIYADIAFGDATTKHVIIPRCMVITTAAEAISKGQVGREYNVPAGALIYGRSQLQSAADDNNSMIAYAVGG